VAGVVVPATRVPVVVVLDELLDELPVPVEPE
jgi:hypothetical protein